MKTTELVAQISQLREENAALQDTIKTAMARRNTGAVPAGAPAARTGEDIMSSRGFSYRRLMGALGKNAFLRKDQCKVEMEFIDRYQRKMAQQGFHGTYSDSVLVPIWPDGHNQEMLDEGMYQEMKSLLYHGVVGADDGEIAFLARKHLGKSAVSPAQSWVDQSIGGTFVPPATMGSPIELLRAKEALMRAGASTVPLGPSGKMVFPRLTAATQASWSGENTQQTPTQAGTGQLNLSAKKVIGTVALPGELLRFASPAVEALVRNDLMLTVALVADYGFLNGPGSDQQPLGLATMVFATGNPYGCQVVSPSNSNQLAPQDFYDFVSSVEEANGDVTAWIMRPKMAMAVYKARWTPYSGGTSQGGFIFDMIRDPDGSMTELICARKVVKSTQVPKTRGSGSQTYVLALNGPDIYVGMFGAIEFTQTGEGWTLLSSDQVAVRALLHCDAGARHPAQVAGCDALNFTVAG